MNNNDKIALVLFALLCIALMWVTIDNYEKKFEVTIKDVTPLHELMDERVCYSPFDVYHVAEYTITEDNLTLITSHGRVYHVEDCRLAIGDTP